MDKEYSVLDGTDLILSVNNAALGFSTSCKVSTSVELGQRITKETSSGKWPEKYVKSFSEKITADGCVLKNGDTNVPTYDELKELMLAETPIEAMYSLRDGNKRTGKTAGGYKGKFLITSLDLDGPGGDDAKYSVGLESSGKVEKIGNGLNENEAVQAAQEAAPAAQV